MIVGSEVFVSVFATHEVANFLREMFAETFEEFLEVYVIERVVGWDIMSRLQLLCVALRSIPICESDEAIAEVIDMQTAFVDDAHSPHESAIKTATETLATGHFHLS